MAEPKAFPPVKLVCGIMSSADAWFEWAETRLVREFGPMDLRSPRRPFDLTDYYRDEMGAGLERMFISFERLIPPESLSDIKLRTNALEGEARQCSGTGLRPVNLDPGYLTRAALIMATAKDFSHRVPLRDGVYAHLEFLFAKDSIRVLDWTYPDLRGDRYGSFFVEARRVYLAARGGDTG